MGSRGSFSPITRARVSKACDECRSRKSKCEESIPCRRCRRADRFCTFTKRRRTTPRMIPDGYVEFLEQQRSLLVQGLRELYRRACQMQYQGPLVSCVVPSSRHLGHGREPLVHDILASLGVLSQITAGVEGNQQSRTAEPAPVDDCGLSETVDEETQVKQSYSTVDPVGAVPDDSWQLFPTAFWDQGQVIPENNECLELSLNLIDAWTFYG